ncbi:uncharacterized protein LTHEOB_10390 [Lasiodiplodia theobromae]|uniref:uncharacterized protein n=1 Tax=Lasiodiplodia theobromae TaxID=45133 RepID=UPI0015C3279D|nr:uncharacterized protein LTHEOB_10390 [Lasiodiplodia theobromae]KAF4539226.1 hypothetical protein LTHEOB_10390 [Lasiodiplodia theobromae]
MTMSISGIPTLFTREPEIGNSDAGQDLYGLGVRIGFYLQSLGMLLYMYSGEKDYGQGLKVASGSITISMLASWFGYAARGLLSPAEAVIVLLIIISLNFPAKATLANSRTIVGEMLGLATMLVVELATCAALLWTFARLVDGDLPTLGTPNVVFFFAEVGLNGWFRYLVLVYCAIDALTSLSFAYKVIRVAKVVGGLYFKGRIGEGYDWKKTEPETLKEIDEIMGWKQIETIALFLAWPLWILVVVAVELTIRWNHLTPSNDLRTPGQLMALITGIIIITDAALVAGRYWIPRCMEPIVRRIPAFKFCNIRTFMLLEALCGCGWLRWLGQSGSQLKTRI